MMGGRGPMTCKFGVQCHRQDCWYSHPDGRLIDAPGGGGGGAAAAFRHENGHISNGIARGPLVGVVGVSGMVGGRPRTEGGVPQLQPSPRISGRGGGVNECRYGFECKRPGCHFNHPFGRAIDGDGNGRGGTFGTGSGRTSLNRVPSSSGSVGSLIRGMSELSFGSYPPASATDDDQDLKETWFPGARDCTCCKGYVYGCMADICQSMGQCTCSIEEQDLDGFSPISSRSIPRTGSPQFEVVANGSSTIGIGAGMLQPPPSPTEGAIAAAAVAAAATMMPARATAGAGRPSPKQGGRTECRYGTGCKRPDCSFSHPLGRSMDADVVSFGDFGVTSVSRGEGSRQSMVDQDLMDTWYPDCRDCHCCKGYKHGCKTAACAEAGICACSTVSNGQATGHIAGGPIPPSSVTAPPHQFPSGSPPNGNNASQMPSTEEGESAAGGNVEETMLDGGGDATSQPAEAVAAA